MNSTVLSAESFSMLTYIYLGFENKYQESLFYSRALWEKYPENLLYLTTYVRDLLLLKRYNEAENLIIASHEERWNKFFQAQFIILKGIIQEKKYLDNKLAQQYYSKGISEISIFGDYGNEYAAYAYFGLSRISEKSGEKHTHKIYRREATKLAEFKKVDFDK
jgi:hypothetical protein